MRPALMLACCLACACAGPRALAPSPFAHHADAVDWRKAGDEMVQVLSGYLQVDTVNPPGNETAGARYFADLLEKEGLSSQVYEFAPGRGSLVARLPATLPSGEKPLCLLSHLDVVSAEAAQWPKDKQPLSGAIDGEYLWGRGALDMKGLGALELMSFVWLHRAKVPLSREVLLVAVADEEVNNRGMLLMTQQHWGELGCGTVLNEGGPGLRSLLFPGQTVYPVTVAEKGTLWLRLTAHGEAGHGSTPVPGRAPMKLVEAARIIGAFAPAPRIHPSLYELLARAGAQRGGLSGFVLQHPALVRALVTPKLLANPVTRAGITDTCQVTGFEGKGSSPNVIPTEVSAIVDCRLLPGTSAEALKRHLEDRLAALGGLTLEVLQSREANASSWEDDRLFDGLERELRRGRPDVVVGPAISPGFTDSIFARQMGARAYGVVPFEIEQEEMKGYHGQNERVSLANVKRGLEALFRAVVHAAAAR